MKVVDDEGLDDDAGPDDDGDGASGKLTVLQKIIHRVVSADPLKAKAYVDKLRQQHRPGGSGSSGSGLGEGGNRGGLSADELARMVVRRKALKSGLVGAATGVGGLLTLPIAVPSALAVNWKIQASLIMAVAHVYGHTEDTLDLSTDIYLVLAGDAAKEALKRFGIEASKTVTRKAVEKYITREVMKKIWKVLGRKIITKAGEKSLTSFVRLIPLVGAPVGFAFDWTSTRLVGGAAIKYYGGKA
jgi:hypothetical protein